MINLLFIDWPSDGLIMMVISLQFHYRSNLSKLSIVCCVLLASKLHWLRRNSTFLSQTSMGVYLKGRVKFDFEVSWRQTQIKSTHHRSFIYCLKRSTRCNHKLHKMYTGSHTRGHGQHAECSVRSPRLQFVVIPLLWAVYPVCKPHLTWLTEGSIWLVTVCTGE